jgi:gliding motility-associated-like protein
MTVRHNFYFVTISKPIPLLIIQLVIVTCLHAQHPNNPPQEHRVYIYSQNQVFDASTTPESDCFNGVDDNGDGLTDADDTHCYFYLDSINYMDCQPTTIIWACSTIGLHWINLATNEEGIVSPADGLFFIDMTWGPNGKIYAIDFVGRIYEVDPLTWSYTPVGFVGGAVGITVDGSGMLYLATLIGLTGEEGCELVKFDPVTHQKEKILRLSDYGLFASGDCCFLDGFMYISCNGYIAKVDVKSKSVEKLRIKQFPLFTSYGMTSIGDGYLYLTDNTTGIYRLDPATMDATLIARFSASEMQTFGFASYVEACHAPCVKPVVSLGADTVVCTNSPLLLTAQSDRTVSSFLWSNGDTSKIATITSPGTYSIKVANKCETSYDTVVISSASKPIVTLPKDTLICEFSSIVLQNSQTVNNNDRILWSDNSDQPTLRVTAPGTYWLQMSNSCGSAADTVQISPKIDSCECFLYIPNAFSPNNDHVNDVFQISSNCLLKGNIQIFNRWGQSVYRSEDLNQGWNGELAGQVQPEGIYVYTIQFSYTAHPETFTRKGIITLLR